MKLNRHQYLAQMISLHSRLYGVMDRIDEELESNKKIKRHIQYRHIGEMPTTGYMSPKTNPEQFEAVPGYPYLLDGLMDIIHEIEMHIHVIGEHTNHDESTDIQHTP